jgi:Protein of unknown function (DUF2652)
MSTITQYGYFVLADISGYTSYLAGVELDHAHEILTDLLELILSKLKTLLMIVQLEGDAVFAYIPEIKIPRGETLLELIENTYVSFRDRITSSKRHTTCPCHACQEMNTLDLKFIIHCGDYIVQNVMGIHELVGSDVNLAHRLLKNHVGEATGWRAYVLLTFSYDLQSRYKEIIEARRVFVSPEDALVVLARDYPVSAPVLWDWLNDPRRRNLYAQRGSEFRSIFLPHGRRGVGAITHCTHGAQISMKETVLDWKPFDYFTVERDSGKLIGVQIMTFLLTPLESGGTRLNLNLTSQILPGFINRVLISSVYRFAFRVLMEGIAKCIGEEQSDSSLNPQSTATQ